MYIIFFSLSAPHACEVPGYLVHITTPACAPPSTLIAMVFEAMVVVCGVVFYMAPLKTIACA